VPCPRQLIEDPTVATERANVMREASWIQPIEVHGRTMLANDCLEVVGVAIPGDRVPCSNKNTFTSR
jgi:hypothetical protein